MARLPRAAATTKHVPYVVAHGLSRQMKLFRDLSRRKATLQQRQHFGLTRRQVELRVGNRLLGHIRDLTEDVHNMFAANERYRAHFDRDATPVTADHHDLGVGDRLVSHDLSREHLLRATRLLGATTDVNRRPRTSPTMRSPAGFTQRITPWASMT
jgi:hypothetical protein